MTRSSFGAIRMQHCSHQILNSGSFTAFIVAPDLTPHLDASDTWILLPDCNQLDGGIPRRSKRVCVAWTAQLHLQFDRARKGLVYCILDRTHRDTTGHRPLTIVKRTFALSVFESLRMQ
jgi:hypothetical protein